MISHSTVSVFLPKRKSSRENLKFWRDHVLSLKKRCSLGKFLDHREVPWKCWCPAAGSFAKMQLLFSVIVITLFCGSVRATDSCYAPPDFYGGKCSSQQGLISGCCTQITYSIDVLGDTFVYCEALGTGNPYEGEECTFGWYPGPTSAGPATLGWSSSAGTPALRCKGVPFGSSLYWDWSSHGSDLYCPLYCPGATCSTPTCICSKEGDGSNSTKPQLSKNQVHSLVWE